MKKINIISTDRPSKEGFYIAQGEIYSSVKATDGGNYYSTSRVDNSSSPDRPITISELYSKLSSRRWHNPTKRIVDGENNLYLIKDTLENSDYSSSSLMDFEEKTYIGQSSTNLVSLMSETINSGDMSTFTNEKYKDIMENSMSINLYTSSKMEIDLTDEGRFSMTVDLIDKGQYTNTISLLSVEKKYSLAGLAGVVDLTVKYSRDGNVYLKNLTFEAFKFMSSNQGVVSTKENFINSINNSDVLVEYVDGIIRVIPESDSVDECIINNCVVTYGVI